MTKVQIDKLIDSGRIPDLDARPELVETHISWVLIGNQYVFKIKKPVSYSFLDFSTLEKRKFYCEREVALNKRLTDGIYIDVQPVRDHSGQYAIGTAQGELVDYAVKMHKMNRNKQMNILLKNNQVTVQDIRLLADKIAHFHKNTQVIRQKDVLNIKNDFSDLENEKHYLKEQLHVKFQDIIQDCIALADSFIETNKTNLIQRLDSGYYRDGHGDLHSRNIFLLPAPQPFDCIEFNDDFRQIDVLNDIAFLCMDLDSYNRQDLSELFFNHYNELFPTVSSKIDYRLFIYYKAYRSNIRAKVNSLRARSADNENDKIKALNETEKYLLLMQSYMDQMDT